MPANVASPSIPRIATRISAFCATSRSGDEIDVTRSDGKQFRYRADRTAVVRFDASGIDPLTDGYELVLSTCWPFDALTPGPERYLLHATMIGAGFLICIGSARPLKIGRFHGMIGAARSELDALR